MTRLRQLAVLGVLVGSFALPGATAFGGIVHPYTGHQLTGFKVEPGGVAFDSVGNLYVIDPVANAVDVYNPAGEPQPKIGAGELLGESEYRSVAVDRATGDVLVAGNGFVKAFKPTGEGHYESSAQWNGVNTPSGSYFGKPMTVAIDNSTSASDPRKGDVYVLWPGISPESGRLYVLKLGENGSEGERVAELTPPPGQLAIEKVGLGLAVDSTTGDVYASAGEQHQFIDEFDDEGHFVRQLDGSATPTGSFGGREKEGGAQEVTASNGEISLAVDESNDHLFVLDRKRKVVDEFGPGLEYLGQINGLTLPLLYGFAENAPYAGPNGIAVNSAPGQPTTGEIYVADGASNPDAVNAVEIFGRGDTVAAEEARTGAASNVHGTSATLSGSFEPGGQFTLYHFEYGPGEYFWARTPNAGSVSGGGAADLTALEPGRTYYYRLVAENEEDAGPVFGEYRTFTTPAAPEALGAVGVTGTTAQVALRISPARESSYQLEYGLSTAYGTNVAIPVGAAGSGSELVNVNLTGLLPGRIYYYRYAGITPAGVEYSSPQQFMTVTPAPEATTGAAQNVTGETATLIGTVNPLEQNTTYQFQYGTTAAYGAKLPAGPVYAGSGSTAIVEIAGAGGLAPNATYHYRLLAHSAGGTTYGADQTFTTPPAINASLTPPLTLTPVKPPVIKALTSAQKLSKALATCKKLNRRNRRVVCERAARKRYPTAKKKGK
jgi:hypothetical protein